MVAALFLGLAARVLITRVVFLINPRMHFLRAARVQFLAAFCVHTHTGTTEIKMDAMKKVVTCLFVLKFKKFSSYVHFYILSSPWSTRVHVYSIHKSTMLIVFSVFHVYTGLRVRVPQFRVCT